MSSEGYDASRNDDIDIRRVTTFSFVGTIAVVIAVLALRIFYQMGMKEQYEIKGQPEAPKPVSRSFGSPESPESTVSVAAQPALGPTTRTGGC